MEVIIQKMSGKKTYLVGALMVVYVVLQYALKGDFDTEFMLQALAVLGMRSALANK